MTRTLANAALIVAAGGLLVMTATPLQADLGGVAPDSWSRLLRYAACALSIAAATTGLGVAAAVAVCLHLFVTEA